MGTSGRSQHKSFRLPSDVATRLEQRAEDLAVSQTELAERYIDEGLRQDAHPSITFRGGAGGRRPALAGTRLDVWQVIETLRAHGGSVEETAAYLTLSEREVRACIAYYAAFTDEIDAWISRVQQEAERQEATWRREQEIVT